MPVGQIVYMSLFALGTMTYIFSMILEVFPGWPGFGVLLMGWIQVLSVGDQGPFVAFAWLANPLVIVAWILSFQRKNKAAIASAGSALVLSISFLLGRHVMTDEAGIGGYSPQQHGPAYDFWLASIAIAFFATIVRGALERD